MNVLLDASFQIKNNKLNLLPTKKNSLKQMLRAVFFIKRCVYFTTFWV